MRSPPVHHAPLNTDRHETHDSYLDNAKATLLRDLPPFVATDIIDVPRACSFRDVQAERDRRLRLLIRRYVNQIQYGCLNRNCSVPTCLSYRKRNNKGAVRVYSDLSARSLACHLIEEHSKAGRDPNGGLCQHQPVVPWYRDPASHHRRRSYDRHTEHMMADQTNGSITAPIVPHSAHPHHDQHSEERHQRQAGQRPKADASQHIREESDADDKPAVSRVQHSPTTTSQVASAQRYDQAGHADQLPPSKDISHASASSTKIDYSSYTQTIWNTTSLRQLNLSPCISIASDQLSPHRDASTRAAKQCTAATDDAILRSQTSADPVYMNTAFCGLTLQRLRWTTLHWMITMKHNHGDWKGTLFEIFLRQSLFYSFGSPQRLVESVKTWTRTLDHMSIVYGSGSNQESEPSSGFLHQDEKASHEERDTSTTEKDSAVRRQLSPTALDICAMWKTFGYIERRCISFDDLFSILHTTVQSCYSLAPQTRATPSEHMTKTQHINSSYSPTNACASLGPEPRAAQLLSMRRLPQVLASVLLALVTPFHIYFRNESDKATLIDLFTARDRSQASPCQLFHYGLRPTEATESLLGSRVAVDANDVLENWAFNRLSVSIMDCFSHHLAAQALNFNQGPSRRGRKHQSLIDASLGLLYELPSFHSNREKDVARTRTIGIVLSQVAHTVLLKEWDRRPIVRCTSPVGGALDFLARLYHQRASFHLEEQHFAIDFVADAFPDMEMPTQWLNFQPSGQEMHILSFPFLFGSAVLVKHFRSINVTAMRRTFESATAFNSDAKQFLQYSMIPTYGSKEVLTSMRAHMAKYFVLTIRRSNVLEDAVDQLWRRQRREVLRPLRLRLGREEGEEGLDHGGVQQEFFRLAFAEAFDPERGMFVVDDHTHMTWFQPGSLELPYKFEALGILMSLAIYNAVTLPITMPLAFYRKLLGLKVKRLEHIVDGWPDLANGLQRLLDFDGNVAEIIGRTYEFSYEFAGNTINFDMQKEARSEALPPIRVSKRGKEKAKSTSFELPVQLNITPPSQSPPSELRRSLSRTSSMKGITTPLSLESDDVGEAAVVTNENREQYVKDYIIWLTDKSIQPQWNSFAKGFFTCINPTALTLFTPQQLQRVVEGYRDIDIDGLEGTATYEEYSVQEPYIRDLWAVVRDMTKQQHRQLLEFVTASNRVPVNGLDNINFVIQKHGEGDERLPQSGTCYQHLLLPQYSSKEILREKLSKALENSLGFGSV